MRWRVAHDPSYSHVTICKEWDDPRVFVAWALANGFKPHLWLDRKDNELGYSPENCRWVTTSDSCRNRRWTHARQVVASKRHAEMVEKIKVPVVDRSTGTVYGSVDACAKALGFRPDSVSRAICKGWKIGGIDIRRVNT